MAGRAAKRENEMKLRLESIVLLETLRLEDEIEILIIYLRKDKYVALISARQPEFII
jgi:hypothetical protein